jgi:hypothetical protein
VRWQQTPWGRILIGLVLSQGLFYGLWHLLEAVQALAGGSDAVRNVLILQGAQALSLFLGGVLAGGGQRHALALGAVVGVWNGVFAVLLKQNAAHGLTFVSVYSGPLLHAAIGAVGGAAGGLIWKPLPPADEPAVVRARKPPRPRVSPFAGRVAWVRVLVGTGLAVAGSLCATLILDKMLDLSAGHLGTTNELQDWLITLEIKALAVLVGGGLAGATTLNGAKQGLFVGLATALVLIAVPVTFGKSALSPVPVPLTGESRWFFFAGLTLVSSLGLALAGGWFGGQLFPPVVKWPRGRKFEQETMS